MTIFFAAMQDNYSGYAAVFACIGLGFLFLRKVDSGEVGPGYWAAGFLMNSLGFIFWGGVPALLPWQYALLGEICHIAGFFLMICGAYRFTGNAYTRWNIVAAAIWGVIWVASLALVPIHLVPASVMLKLLRAVLFIWAGRMILRNSRKELEGRHLAGWSLIAWGLYVALFGFLRVTVMLNMVFGFLVGFQILAAFGLVAMVVGRMRLRAEESELHVKRLEGLLPICSYCKKIRDKRNKWHVMEAYIEERTAAEFSHGICPDCMAKHHPEYK